MKRHGYLILTFGTLLFFSSACPSAAQDGKTAIVIHGGTGSAGTKVFLEENEAEHHRVIRESLNAGHAILQRGGSSLDAVQAAIVVLEDSPLFNAGKGAVFTSEGKNELDASIMNGETLKAGAVGGVTTVKNPILAARAVMEKTWHVLLVSEGADEFARESGLEIVSPEYFRTERQWEKHLEERRREQGSAPGDGLPEGVHFGTVGAVALDKRGNLAAGTSTGGLMNKKFGRIGDSPIIGAGTYADNASCAISCTGQGEFFMRRAIAFDISARMKYGGSNLAEAARGAIQDTLTKDQGSGGIIGLDRQGNVVVEYNTPGMVRGFIDTSGVVTIGF